MTTATMELAGKFAGAQQFSDEELVLAIKGTALALAYLEGRGKAHWELAIRPLRRDLDTLTGYAQARKDNP